MYHTRGKRGIIRGGEANSGEWKTTELISKNRRGEVGCNFMEQWGAKKMEDFFQRLQLCGIKIMFVIFARTLWSTLWRFSPKPRRRQRFLSRQGNIRRQRSSIDSSIPVLYG